MDRGGRWGPTLLAGLALAACAAPLPPEQARDSAVPPEAAASPDPGSPAEFLRRAVRGEQPSILFASWVARYPGSPHRADSEEFEASVRAFEARTLPASVREALIGDLRAVLAGTDAPYRRRAATTLGRLGEAAALEDLLRVAEDPADPVRPFAIDALGWFGEGERAERFTVYGGRFRAVVFPPAPDGRARAALLRILRSPAPDPGASADSGPSPRVAALDAAIWHDAPDLDAAAPELGESRAEPSNLRGRAPGIYHLR